MKRLWATWLRPSRGVGSVVVLGAVVVATFQAMTGYELWRQHATAITLAERNLNILADVLAGEIERNVRAVDQVIELTTLDLSTHAERPPADSRRVMRDRALGVPAIFGLLAVDGKGTALASMHTVSPRHHAFVESIREAARSSGRPFYIGEVRPDPFDSSPIIPFGRFRHDAAGDVDGMTIASMSVSFFRELLLQVKPLPGVVLTLARQDGAILSQVPEASDKSMAGMPEFASHTADRGLIKGDDQTDGDRIAAFRTIRPFGLKLSVAIDSGNLLAPWRSNALRLVLADGAMSLLVAAIVTLMARGKMRDRTQDQGRREFERSHHMALFALDNSADMVVWADERGEIIYANRSAHQRLGWDQGELTGKHVGEIDPAFPPHQWPQRMAELRRSGSVRFESSLRDSIGRDLPAEVAVGLFSWDGRDYSCAVIRDIVERRRAEALLAERTRRLEASNAELEQFAYVASHDLREPLRMVSSFVGLLTKRFGDQMNAEAREYLEFAREGAIRMDRLILDLLEYSRVGTDSRPLAPVELARIAQTVRHDLGPALDQAGATLTVAEPLPMVWGDGDELGRLLTNLVGNALKYRHPDRPPRIELTAQVNGGEVTCQVRDNGIGISPQYFDRIFRIFQRLHGRDRYDGTGIGLAICKKIVERHGGRIWVASSPDQGATFFFTLRSATKA